MTTTTNEKEFAFASFMNVAQIIAALSLLQEEYVAAFLLSGAIWDYFCILFMIFIVREPRTFFISWLFAFAISLIYAVYFGPLFLVMQVATQSNVILCGFIISIIIGYHLVKALYIWICILSVHERETQTIVII